MTRVELPPGPDGKRRRKDFKAQTQQAALDKKQQYLTNLARHIEPEGLVRKVREFGDWWIDHEAPETCNSTTVRGYRDTLRLHIYPVIGHMRLQEVRGKHIDTIVSIMLEKGLSLSSRKAARRVVSTMFSAARRRDLIDDNPVTRSKPPRLAPGEMSRPRSVFTPDEINQVLRALKGHEYEHLIKLTLYAGTRRGEAMAITWADLWTNGDAFGVVISKQVKEVPHESRDGKTVIQLEVTNPKTRHGFRRVPIPKSFFLDLMAKRPANSPDDAPIFESPSGGYIWPSNVTKAWRKFADELGFTEARLHDNRHSFATNALDSGASIDALKDVLGHHSITITKDTYGGRTRDSAERVAAALYPTLEFADEVQTLERAFAMPTHEAG